MGPMSDGHVTGVVTQGENLGVNFPPKNCIQSGHSVVSLACMHDWGDRHEILHDKNSYFLWKKITLI
jgi:hypothetical protein